jgi:hypothetical protein
LAMLRWAQPHVEGQLYPLIIASILGCINNEPSNSALPLSLIAKDLLLTATPRVVAVEDTMHFTGLLLFKTSLWFEQFWNKTLNLCTSRPILLQANSPWILPQGSLIPKAFSALSKRW